MDKQLLCVSGDESKLPVSIYASDVDDDGSSADYYVRIEADDMAAAAPATIDEYTALDGDDERGTLAWERVFFPLSSFCAQDSSMIFGCLCFAVDVTTYSPLDT